MANSNGGQKKGAVMVIGAGVAGMQASLDLADSGYFVYLVEKEPSIGGVMSQLDKTFPTNDCAMCIVSPKLVEVGRHLNVELLTLTEVQGISGEPGNFTVQVLQKPRYVDSSKCTGCGDCAQACPVVRENEYDAAMSKRKAAYRRYPQAVPGTFSIEKRGTSPCKVACPAHISVQGYVALAAQGQYLDALKLVKQENPLPAICGRICHHPCESACMRSELDQPVAIDSIKRYIADLDLSSDTRYIPELKQKRDEKIAVIGSGPAGLTCAYYLAIEGYQVTIFEKLPVLGGMLTVGIPSYRLPRDTIQSEIEVIRSMGVEFKTGVEIGKDITVAQLREQGYKAFFVGIGAHECKALGIEGESLEGVYPGVDFLREMNLGKKINLGDRVAVIGGGNVAMDAVRSALRGGSTKPVVVYRRSVHEMPANEEEIEECREEGIEIMTLTNPVRIIGENGRVKALECVKMRLGEPDASGRRRPETIPDSNFIMEVDTVIPAIGQESDWACLTAECACQLSNWGTMTVDSLTLQSHDPDIFAGGDAVTGPKTVIEAIAAGKQAAISIDRFLQGQDLREGREKEWKAVQDVRTEGYDRIPRAHMPRLAPELRVNTFDEVQLGLIEEQVRKEAERCLSCGVCSECYKCEEACLAKAIDHDQQPVFRDLEVGAVILAPGNEIFNPSQFDTYSYASLPNVVTSIEFERILSASGPYQGHLLRPSDEKEPQRIAWLQCVGSRNINKCDNSYCSAVCCMYAIKEAVIAKEHSHDPLDAAIFYMDMRTYGKEFEQYYNRAKEQGVRFVRSRIHTIDSIPDSDNLKLSYVTETGEMREEEFDMVVLSVGFEVGKETADLAKRLGVELNRHKFAVTDGFMPVATSKPGVFVCGTLQGPKDIPQSVMEASGAAAGSSALLSEARWTETKTRELPAERFVGNEPARIGVFVCNCGINIGGIVDVPAVREYARTLPNVVHVEDNLFTCSQDTQVRMSEVIKEKGINRMVVAACTPLTHEPLFRETLMETGLNKYLFEMANIRNQDSWVHMNDKEKATEKAKDLVRMSVARAGLLKELHEKKVSIQQGGLVIGGGVAGLNAALNLAQQGFDAVLIEKGKELGGLARHVSHTIDGLDVQTYMDGLVANARANDRIRILTEAEVVSSKGYKGNFTTKIKVGSEGAEQTIEHGVTIVATGAHEYRPKEFLYGEHDRVMTQLELDKLLHEKTNGTDPSQWEHAVMIQCVGSRNEENPNCSRICCQSAVKHALQLKEINPDMDVTILYRDMRTYGVLEDYYTEARRKGVIFSRFDPDHVPEVSAAGERVEVTFVDHVLQRPIRRPADAVILSAATLANETDRVASQLKIPRNASGFFIEAHAKLRPVDFSSEGIYLCGTAHSPKLISESITQALAAASRAGAFLAKKNLIVGGPVAHVDKSHCAACLVCVMSCPYGIPQINEENVSEINEALCQGCGTCVSECPAKAIQLSHYEDDQLVVEIHSLLEGVS